MMLSLSSTSGADVDQSKLSNRSKPTAQGTGGQQNDAGLAEVDAPHAPVGANVSGPSTSATSVSGEIFGRTEGGEIFSVPPTHDMLHTLLDPRLSKTPMDVATVFILLSYVGIYWILPSSFRTPVFLLMFLFWRGMYNAGIGYILMQQSDRKLLTVLASEYDIFGLNSTTSDGKGGALSTAPAPRWIQKLVQQDLKARLKPKSQTEIDGLPLEFKTWILFRHFVDLILMSDFINYVLLAISVLHVTNHPWYIALARWLAGISLLLFNVWVKIDAHRVVKDFAWYWGDFFFLEDVNLTFDGVFEMAPHPMYSIGYAAYYGVSLMTSSYTLFFASIVAHAAQFAFLILVENPHIEKTYGSPPTPASSSNVLSTEFDRPTPQAMMIFKNFNFTRTSDIFLVFTAAMTLTTYFVPRSGIVTFLTVGGALVWRLAHSLGLGVLLARQSKRQQWTKLHLKYGGTPLEAYQQWQAIYNVTLVMSYVSLIALWLRELSSPDSVSYWLFRVIVGAMLISVHVWTSYSIFEELGEYGWFFGDFFYVKRGHQLSYSGIYRYMNHPERFIGIAGVWGMALIGYSTWVTFIAFVYSFTNVAFIQFVEKPHMLKLYGAQSVERTSGISKNIRKQRSLLPAWVDIDGFERTVAELWQRHVMVHFDNLELLRPHVEGVVNDTKEVLRQYPAKMTDIMSDNVQTRDRAQYSVRTSKQTYALGEPILAAWQSESTRSVKDWIGIYHLGVNTSTEITSKSSASRWSAVDPKGYDNHISTIVETGDTKGQVLFTGRALFWEPGQYELRYHHNGKHNVMAVSEPFEIVVERQSLANKSVNRLSEDLAGLYAHCVGTTPSALPEPWNLQDNEVLARFTESIRHVYDIDLAPFVIQADGTSTKIAERLIFVRNSLATANAA